MPLPYIAYCAPARRYNVRHFSRVSERWHGRTVQSCYVNGAQLRRTATCRRPERDPVAARVRTIGQHVCPLEVGCIDAEVLCTRHIFLRVIYENGPFRTRAQGCNVAR